MQERGIAAMAVRVLAVTVLLLSIFCVVTTPVLSSELPENNNMIQDDLEHWKQLAEQDWYNRRFESLLHYIQLLWDHGEDDPYYDLLACCDYFILKQYEASIEKGLTGFKKLEWSIYDDLPDLYTEFAWCDIMWAMGGAYMRLGQYAESVMYLEKLLNYDGFSDNKTLLYYEEKLLLYYKMELCYRELGWIDKAEQMIDIVKDTEIFALIYSYWKETGETKIDDNTPYLFYEYVMNYKLEKKV